MLFFGFALVLCFVVFVLIFFFCGDVRDSIHLLFLIRMWVQYLDSFFKIGGSSARYVNWSIIRTCELLWLWLCLFVLFIFLYYSSPWFLGWFIQCSTVIVCFWVDSLVKEYCLGLEQHCSLANRNWSFKLCVCRDNYSTSFSCIWCFISWLGVNWLSGGAYKLLSSSRCASAFW